MNVLIFCNLCNFAWWFYGNLMLIGLIGLIRPTVSNQRKLFLSNHIFDQLTSKMTFNVSFKFIFIYSECKSHKIEIIYHQISKSFVEQE